MRFRVLNEDKKVLSIYDVLDDIDGIVMFDSLDSMHFSDDSIHEDLDDDEISDEEFMLDLSDDELKRLDKSTVQSVTNIELLDRLYRIRYSDLTKEQKKKIRDIYDIRIPIGKREVEYVLNKIKRCKRIHWGGHHDKTIEFMSKNNLDDDDCLNILKNMTAEDYIFNTGSINPYHLGHNLMIFEPKNVKKANGEYLGDFVVYVKLDINESTNIKTALVSMHKAEHTEDKHPYKIGENKMRFKKVSENKKRNKKDVTKGSFGFFQTLTGGDYEKAMNQFNDSVDFGGVTADGGNAVSEDVENESIKEHREDIEDRLRDIEEMEYRDFNKARSDLQDLMQEERFDDRSVDEILIDFDNGSFEIVYKKIKDRIINTNQSKVENKMTIDEFIDKAEVILVDDAENFDINEWEKKVQDEIDEELEEESSEEETSQYMFVKYKISQADLKKVVDKLKTSSFDTLDGVTSWKTRQFLKKNNLTVADLQEVLRSISESDYKTNSIPTDKNSGYNDAIIFVKTSKIKEIGPFRLYIKLDYDRIENTPVILISVHSSGKVRTGKTNEELEDNKKTLRDYFNECVENLNRIGLTVDNDITLIEKNHVASLASITPNERGWYTIYVDTQLLEGTEEDILNTLYHELAHYLVFKKAVRYGILEYDKFDNEWYLRDKERWEKYNQHGEEWRKMVDLINFRLGTNIQRIAPEIKAVSDRYEKNAKYTIECNNCHNKFYYYRRSRFVDDVLNGTADHYECPYCKTKGDYTLIEK